ncbi:MAG: sulfotransferase [Desulfobulbaceae bacterium]|nr:sulfotransferase [Desulfobulbaceae bacterium]
MIGMHRSGTTMVTELLEKSGYFFGAKQESNHEATFFLKLNEWMMKHANASWSYPQNFQHIDEGYRNEMIKVMGFHLRSYKRFEFLGLRKSLKYNDIKSLDFAWGWKDPRNTFTIDIWKKKFPEAKLLHIYRNPIDVVESLRKRELNLARNFKKWLTLSNELSIKEILLVGKLGYYSAGSPLWTENIYEGIKLWESYVNKAFSLGEEFKDRILHVRYEDILEKPSITLNNVFRFVGLETDTKQIENIAQLIRPERRYVFLKNEGLRQIYDEIKDKEIMKKLQYESL